MTDPKPAGGRRNPRRERNPHPHPVAFVDDIPPGGRLIVEVEGRSIGVFNVGGVFHAIRNLCPHQGAPLCEGRVLGTTLPSRPGEYILGRTGEIVRCPWHGWEFDITTGRSVFDPGRCRVRSYPVTVVAAGEAGSPEVGPSVESYPVTVEGSRVVVHV